MSVHAQSLVNRMSHSTDLLDLVTISLSDTIKQYLIRRVEETVNFALELPMTSSSSAFSRLVARVLRRGDVEMRVILVTLVYVDRAKPHLQISRPDWIHHRVFLGALVVASKYVNDCTLKNVHWAECTGIFTTHDIGIMERDFLTVLDYQLGVKEDDIMAHHASLMVQGLERRGGRMDGNCRIRRSLGNHVHPGEESADNRDKKRIRIK
ncbi:hypothetical protein B0H14DRAFT_3138994 [Mycena olivaceomarginata]|nr:hypothetical protein B0H14DRAFT_3138994 [Mycena olivaceomarginata]